ncbi:MAG: radical SAM protein [Elusimicrobiota bacterium]
MSRPRERVVFFRLFRGDRRLSFSVFRKAIDAILASGDRRRVHLVFLADSLPERFALLRRLVEAARNSAAERGREIACSAAASCGDLNVRQRDFLISQEVGLRLTPPPAQGGPAPSPDPVAVRRRLSAPRRLAAQGVAVQLSMTLNPRDVRDLPAILKEISALGLALRISVRWDEFWDLPGIDALARALDEGLRRALQLGKQPASTDADADLLNDHLLVDADGGVIWANAALLLDRFPECGRDFSLPFEALRSPPRLIGDRRRLARALLTAETRSAECQRVLAGGMRLTLRLTELFRRLRRPPRREGGRKDSRSENLDFIRLCRGGFLAQEKKLSADIPDLKIVLLWLRTGCANDCAFCGKKVEPPEPLAVIARRLRKGRGRLRKVGLVGSDPLLHPRLPEIVRLCREQGFEEIEIMTSGTLLHDRALADALAAAGTTGYAIPLFSADALEHDMVAGRPGSFHETMRGIENLRRRTRAKIFIHSHLLRRNMSGMPRLEAFVRETLGLPFAILPIRPKDDSDLRMPYEELFPSYREMIDTLKVRSLAAFPVCVMRRIQGDGPNLDDCGRIADVNRMHLRGLKFVKPDACRGCGRFDNCVGSFSRHLQSYPDDRLELS